MSGHLEVRDLRVSYGVVEAVRGLTFDVPNRSLVSLLGANGAGKSSTLAAIAGLVRPASGQVLLNGEDVTGWSSHRLVEAGLVLVPEGREILTTLTVEENLRLGAWYTRDRFGEGLADVYDRFQVLADRRRLTAGSLSGGEQQMLAIARALLARPRVLLLDEPSMGLAPKLVDEVFAVIDRIRAEGTTVLLIEQNARRALRVADHGYVMETGELVLQGTAEDLLTDRKVVDAYLGT